MNTLLRRRAMITKTGGDDVKIQRDEWTVESDFKASTQDFYYSQYCDRTFKGIQIFEIQNNSAANSYGRYGFVDSRTGIDKKAFWNESLRGASSGYLFYIAAGATIVRYKIKEEDFPE